MQSYKSNLHSLFMIEGEFLLMYLKSISTSCKLSVHILCQISYYVCVGGVGLVVLFCFISDL